MFKQAYLYFILLMIILVIGFWPSYFSQLDQQHSFARHFHSIIMLIWCLLLISQAWLMRSKNFPVHKQAGRLAFIIGPLVIASAVYVAFDFVGRIPPPYPPGLLGIHWFGLFLAALFAFLFTNAIYYRKTPALHARYMIATAFVFLMPGFGRAVSSLFIALEKEPPSLFSLMFIPLIFMLILVFMDLRKKQNARPFIYLTVAWGANMILYKALPETPWWTDFTVWCHELMA